MITYPNQKIIHIIKEPCVDNFVQIKNEDWMEAARDLSGTAFKLYMYLAANADGFELALSRKDATNNVGISSCAYDDGIEALTKKGYLEKTGGNTYTFRTRPIICSLDEIFDEPEMPWEPASTRRY